jgi:AcrR family transcriptional regulator
MRRSKPSVKRQYDSTARRERAEQTRCAIIDAAERRFLADGYSATTVAEVATDAGVSAETVYKAFGSKPGLVRAIRERALAGEGTVPAEQRSDALAQYEADARKIFDGWGRLTAEVAPRTMPILLLVRDAAATDPEMAALRDELDADRHGRMTENARRLHKAGHLRRGMTVREAADVLWAYSAPELYELLVLRQGWSAARHGRFVANGMAAAILP